MSNPSLLGLAIPTYKRINETVKLVDQIIKQYSLLPSKARGSLIRLLIVENPSTETPYKIEKLRKSLSLSTIDFSIRVNEENIGGDNNICYAYAYNMNTKYKWVLGDDERLLANSLKNITIYLLANPDLGLGIVQDNSYAINSEIIGNPKWENYAHFAQHAAVIQPHLMIAHTLISANIIKQSAFNYDLAKKEISLFSDNHNLQFCFAHMKGILMGMFIEKRLSVGIIETPAIDTSHRKPSSDMPEIHEGDALQRLYRAYFCFICYQFGIDIDIAYGAKGMEFLVPLKSVHKVVQVHPLKDYLMFWAQSLKVKLRSWFE